jgi:hypothetical protein
MKRSWRYKLTKYLILKLNLSGLFIRLYPVAIENHFSDVSREKLDKIRSYFELEIDDSLKLMRLGDMNDGGYVLVDDIHKTNVCLSFGIGSNYSFDLEIAELCEEVWMFDHTIEPPTQLLKNMKFFSKGVSSIRNTDMVTINDVMDQFGCNVDFILKIDIEGSEWDVINDLTSDNLLKCKQIIIEFHDLHKIGNDNHYNKIVKALEKVTKFHSLRNIHANNWANFELICGLPTPDVIEATLYRNNFDKVDSYSSVTLSSLQNKPNNGDLPEDEINFISAVRIKTNSRKKLD